MLFPKTSFKSKIYCDSFFFFRESPPYYAYGLACLQFLIGGLYWTAAQKYANKVAPPSLVGTMTGIVGSVNWIIAKGDTKMLQKPFFFRKQNQRDNDQLNKIPLRFFQFSIHQRLCNFLI